MLIIILTALVICSASLTILAEYFGPRRAVYLCKPLTITLLILIALQTKQPVSVFYQRIILVGLLFSLAGDVFLMLPRDRFIQGLLCFLCAHLCYIVAFAYDGGRATPLWSALPFLLYGIVMLRLLWPRLKKMKVPVVVYTLAISLMAWLALTRWLASADDGRQLAFLGALLFVASDSFLAVNRFKGRTRFAQFSILSTYFTAQWLIALST
ncbi:MAG TPA: lysoplasmalogenase [Pyrinomonadaceae bacterium]|jgi:uncharacterized membrane protein YhhN